MVGQRARGDAAYEATYRAITWLSWDKQNQIKTYAWVSLKEVYRLVHRVCQVTPGQASLRIKLLVADGVVKTQGGRKLEVANTAAAQAAVDVQVRRRTDKDAIVNEIREVLDELPISKWQVDVTNRYDGHTVQFGGYQGVPVHEALLLIKLARLGDKSMKERDALHRGRDGTAERRNRVYRGQRRSGREAVLETDERRADHKCMTLVTKGR